MRCLLILLILVLPGAQALETSDSFEKDLSPGDVLIIPFRPEWKGDVRIHLTSNVTVDLYIVEGNVSDGEHWWENHTILSSSERVGNTSEIYLIWKGVRNCTIVVDNVDAPWITDAQPTGTAHVVVEVYWEKNVKADPFLTALCCGTALLFLAGLGLIFYRFFLKKPPEVEE